LSLDTLLLIDKPGLGALKARIAICTLEWVSREQ
jgi:hypothetical protein